MTINLNDTVRVKLTDYGVMIHRKTVRLEPQVDDDGYTRYQLWDFMRIFGNEMLPGAPKVINPLDMEVWKK